MGWLKTSASNGALRKNLSASSRRGNFGASWTCIRSQCSLLWSGASLLDMCLNIPISDWPHDTTEETLPGKLLLSFPRTIGTTTVPGTSHPVTPRGKSNHSLPIIIHDPIHTREECLIPLYGQVSLLALCFISSLDLISEIHMDHWLVWPILTTIWPHYTVDWGF